MYITKDQLDQRLSKTQVLIEEKSVQPAKKFRLSDKERELIGTIASIDGPTEVVREFGGDKSTIQKASKGIVGYDTFDKDFKNKVDGNVAALEGRNSKEKIQEQVLSNLADALTNVGLKLNSTDATEASKIAVDMGKLLDRVNGNDSHRKQVAIIINTPNQRNESSYTAIEV